MYEPKDFADTIFKQRYAINEGEKWEDACKRVANHVAQAENGKRDYWSERFTTALVNNRFIPGGRIWYGSGRAKGQLLNCFVIPTEDSREGWAKTVSDMLIISGTGGGVGINYTPIRPRGVPIRGTGGESTGAVSLMQVVNEVGEVIKAGGGRRTALMQCLRYDHPDLLEFLEEKFNKVSIDEENITQELKNAFPNLPHSDVKELTELFSQDNSQIYQKLIKNQLDQKLKNSNVSVLVDNEVFEKVKNDEDIVFEWRNKELSRGFLQERFGILLFIILGNLENPAF